MTDTEQKALQMFIFAIYSNLKVDQKVQKLTYCTDIFFDCLISWVINN